MDTVSFSSIQIGQQAPVGVMVLLHEPGITEQQGSSHFTDPSTQTQEKHLSEVLFHFAPCVRISPSTAQDLYSGISFPIIQNVK